MNQWNLELNKNKTNYFYVRGAYSDEDTDQGAWQNVMTSWPSIGKITLEFLHNFNFNTNLYFVIKKFSHIIVTEASVVYC